MSFKNHKQYRLKNYDYSSNGIYFITVCTKNREEIFGKIEENNISLSEVGEIAKKYWQEIPKHYPFVILDEFAVMPNHLHGIIIIVTNHRRNAGGFYPAGYACEIIPICTSLTFGRS